LFPILTTPGSEEPRRQAVDLLVLQAAFASLGYRARSSKRAVTMFAMFFSVMVASSCFDKRSRMRQRGSQVKARLTKMMLDPRSH
jgi:hypothetical protein